MGNEFNAVGFYYTIAAQAGHNWKGDYKKIINIFCNSAKKCGITPVHICPVNEKPLIENFVFVQASTKRLVYDREQAYLAFLTQHECCIISDPDMVFLAKPPSLGKGYHARLVFRPNDDAAFNGPRMLKRSFMPVLSETVRNMSYMSDKYKTWDGDSSAFANAVYRARFAGIEIELVNESLYQSRPSLIKTNATTSYMYHFKGNAGKDEMFAYAAQEGLL